MPLLTPLRDNTAFPATPHRHCPRSCTKLPLPVQKCQQAHLHGSCLALTFQLCSHHWPGHCWQNQTKQQPTRMSENVKPDFTMRTAFRSFLLIFLSPSTDSPSILLQLCLQRCTLPLNSQKKQARTPSSLLKHKRKKHINSALFTAQSSNALPCPHGTFFRGEEYPQVISLLGFQIFICSI